MAFSGRISVLVSKELQALLGAVRELPREVNQQIRKQTRPMVEPVWQESVRANVSDAPETRVLADTARAAVSDSNVMLRSGGIGKSKNGTPNYLRALPTEFGADRNATTSVTNRKGTTFQRHTKRQFKFPRSRGYVVYPAAREVIPRIASLWAQTAARAVHEMFEKGGAR